MSQMDKLAEPCADACCAPPPLVLPSGAAGDRTSLIRDAFRLEWLTIGWMSIEAVVALISGVAAGSLVLIAFGRLNARGSSHVRFAPRRCIGQGQNRQFIAPERAKLEPSSPSGFNT